jgi:hypothetical protein
LISVYELPFVNVNASPKITNGSITSSNLIGAFSNSIAVDTFNAFGAVVLSLVLIAYLDMF